MKIDGRTKKVLFHAWMNGNWNKRQINNSILSSNNTTSDSFFIPNLKTHEKSDTGKEEEQSQTKRKYSNISSITDEQPNKRRCKAKKFEAIQYSLGPNEEYIAIRSYEYDIWERNEDNLSIIYQDIFKKKDEGWKDLVQEISTNIGEKFKKAQDAEHEVLKRQHTKKVRKSLKLRKHKFENYMWTISSRLKPETITDIKIHPKTKPFVITVFRGTDGRNFDVHKPFAFGEFGIYELDELREIIPKKKNAVVQDLMNSLSRRYERIRKIPEELGIKSALPAPAPEQASSKSSRKKRKHMELEPEIKIPGLECNQALPENVPFINNMVIEEPEYGIFFTDEFGDQAFQRWSDIDKVGMEAHVSYLVAASMVQSPENARFSMKLKKLIAEHPDQEKLKSKKVKVEAFGYEMN
ncbi:hypothetical protein Tco_0968541 [Tanacetum coccineum]